MPIHDHQPAFRGRAFFWGGIVLGLLFVALMLTQGFGLWGGPAKHDDGPAWFVRRGETITVPDGSPLRGRLTVETAQAQSTSGRLILPAIVESDPARTATVIPALGGRVVDLKVRLGDRVTRGQVVAILDSGDLAQAYADFDKAGDALRLMTQNLHRQEEQVSIGVASDRDLDQSRSDAAQAEAELARTRLRLTALDATLDARGTARRLLVRAPVSGSVTTLSVTPGSTVNDATAPLMIIADLSTVWVTAMVAEKDMDAVAKDAPAQVTLASDPGRHLDGHVAFVADVLDADSRREKLRIAFPNADYSLKPNMFATVAISGPALSHVVLPSTALLMNNDRTSVFVATAPWTFERRTVEPQLEDGPVVVIRSGVAAGERVVVKGGILLND